MQEVRGQKIKSKREGNKGGWRRRGAGRGGEKGEKIKKQGRKGKGKREGNGGDRGREGERNQVFHMNFNLIVLVIVLVT